MEQSAEHILACLSPAPSNARIIRTAATMAQAFGCRFTALFVRTPGYVNLAQEDKTRLRQHTLLAQELGATVETVFGDDVSYQIAEYARLSGVTKIVIGRSAARRKHPWSKPTLTEKLITIAPGMDIHIIPDASTTPTYRPLPPKPRFLLRDLGITAVLLALATVLSYVFSQVGFTEANIMAIYLLAVLLTSVATSTRISYILSALGSVLVFNYCFTTPRLSLRVYEHGAPMTFLILIVAALMMGTLTDKLKSQVTQSTRAAYRTNLLLETNQMLQKAQSEDAIFQVARSQLYKLLSREITVYPGENVPADTGSLCYPIRVNDRLYGSVRIAGAEPLEAFENSILLSILGECALVLENSRNTREKEEAKLLAQNEKLRVNLLRSISHDLRTPLTAISGNAGILLSGVEGLSPDTRYQMYSDIYDDAQWLYNLVENLLAVTRIEEGRMELRTQPQLAEEMVSEAMQHINRKKSEHTITVTHQDELLLAKCDARLIVQVLINLVDNAIKYTPPGSTITISTCRQGADAVFSVADDGPGISDAEKGKVFQMFYTGSNPIADSRRSLGLGLSLCRSIVTAHAGQMTVSDNHPRGTVFTFTLPTQEVTLHE